MHLITLISSLALFWLLLSGHTDALLLSLGAISCVGVGLLCHRMDIVDHESHPHHMGRKMPKYWLSLTWETLRANWDVAKAVLQPRRVRPVVGYVHTPLDDDLTRTTLANSITLTPGTLTLDVEEHRMRIHALDAASLNDLRNGPMVARAKALES